jgi:hypothetical protein
VYGADPNAVALQAALTVMNSLYGPSSLYQQYEGVTGATYYGPTSAYKNALVGPTIVQVDEVAAQIGVITAELTALVSDWRIGASGGRVHRVEHCPVDQRDFTRNFRRPVDQRGRSILDDGQQRAIDIGDGVRMHGAGGHERRQPNRPEKQNSPTLKPAQTAARNRLPSHPRALIRQVFVTRGGCVTCRRFALGRLHLHHPKAVRPAVPGLARVHI